MYGGNYDYPYNFNGTFGDTINPSFLEKDSAGIMTLYVFNSSYTAIQDTVTIDFSRTDSITVEYNGSGHYYDSFSILGIDTFSTTGITRKRFNINNGFPDNSDDFVYEGLFLPSGSPLMNGFFEYWNNLTCFDATDSLYFDPNFMDHAL